MWVGNAGCFLVMTYYDENFQNPKSVVMSASKTKVNAEENHNLLNG